MPLQDLLAVVQRDEALQSKLRGIDDAEAFVESVVEAAQALGFSVAADEVEASMRHAVQGASAHVAETSEAPLPPAGYLPVEAFWRADEMWLRWAFFGSRRLMEPFFQGDVQRAFWKPFNRLVQYTTPFARLAEWLDRHPGRQPSGFIFHMSRCGSTLVAQMLAAVGSNIVVSEASPIDAVARAHKVSPCLRDEDQVRWLRQIIAALGQPRAGGERHYVVKLDCWHTQLLPLFRRAFPDTPWVFLYRNPVEVMVSQIRMPGMQMIPGHIDAALVPMQPGEPMLPPGEFCARVLSHVCEPIADQLDAKGLLINYRDLPDAVWTEILPHFGLTPSDADRETMREATRRDAKTPSFEFVSDVESKQNEASVSLREIAEARLGPIYRRLEVLRAGS